MNQKGFSLMEVLFSLLLVSTTVLGLLQQFQHLRQLLNQFILQAGACQFLDEVEEYLLLGQSSLPVPPPPYRFQVRQSHETLTLKLDYFQNQEPITRTMVNVI